MRDILGDHLTFALIVILAIGFRPHVFAYRLVVFFLCYPIWRVAGQLRLTLRAELRALRARA